MMQNTPFILTADHAGIDTQGYRFYVAGVKVDEKPVTALAGGKISFSHPGLPRGTAVLEIAAFNVDGEVRSALTATFTGTMPAAPANLQITAAP